MTLPGFFRDCREAGFDGVIIPDLPAEYDDNAAQLAEGAGLDLIFLPAPTATPERRRLIARLSRGFVYYVSVAGVTGARQGLPADLGDKLREIKALTSTPVCVGFGISQPTDAAAVAALADGAIVGSALVKRVTEALEQKVSKAELVRQLGVAMSALAKAAHGN